MNKPNELIALNIVKKKTSLRGTTQQVNSHDITIKWKFH